MKSSFIETKGFSNFKSNLLESHQGHEESKEQRLKERYKSNFQIRNKTRLRDSKTRTQEHKTKTQDACEINMKTNMYFANICKHDKAIVQDHV
jgi:hypothetical protein